MSFCDNRSGVGRGARPRPLRWGNLMLLRSIRSRLLGLVLATVVPFTALIGFGVWQQWQDDQSAAIQRAVNEARLLAAQVDDHIGNLDNLLTGLSRAVSTNPADVAANDALLRRVKARIAGLHRQHPAVLARWHQYRDILRGRALLGRRSRILPASLGRSAPRDRRRHPRPCARRMGGRRSRVRSRIRRADCAAVLAVGTVLEHFQDALRVKDLPPGSVISIVNEKRHRHRA